VYIIGIDDIPFEVVLNEYDGFNHLVKTTIGDKAIAYAYNGDGLRISKTIDDDITRHVWDGNQVVIEMTDAGYITGKYIRGINLVYLQDSAGTKKYYLFNGHGDVVQLTGSDGNVTKSYDYDAFGS
jgi:YD repeat-containing protein